MLKRKRITKKDIKHDQKVIGKSRKTLQCKECGDTVTNVVADTCKITCWRCVAKSSAPPDLPAKPKPVEERRPRGWQFRTEYRAPDGTLYHRGVKVDEPIIQASTKRTTRSSTRSSKSIAKKTGDNRRHSTTSTRKSKSTRVKSKSSKRSRSRK